MRINAKQLESLVEKILIKTKLHSIEAVDLLMVTSAAESECGEYIKQLNNGPALGVFQMEPATLNDLYDNYLFYKKDKLELLESFRCTDNRELDLEGNIIFQIVSARLQYYRFKEKIPKKENFDHWSPYILALASYWKKYWNTDKGKGTIEKTADDYARIIGKYNKSFK